MDKMQAIQHLSAEIASDDTDLYAFQPRDQKEKFFIGAELITAAAIVLLTAFLKGVESSLQPRVENWGRNLGIWIGDQLESLFKGPPNVESELDRSMAKVSGLIATISEEERGLVADEVEELIADVLRKKEVAEDRVLAIASRTRQAAMEIAKSS